MMKKISSFLKKEYKSITGDTLTLTKDGEIDIAVQNTSKVRCWCQASQNYKIGNLGDVETVKGERLTWNPDEKKFTKGMSQKYQDFVSLGGFKGEGFLSGGGKSKRPSNDTRKK